jgi:aminoglycoside phosphotransferase (APT) family kinase protein
MLADPARLAVWLDREGLEAGQPLTVEPLPGGSSNALFAVDRGASRWVLRRPAEVAVERADEDPRVARNPDATISQREMAEAHAVPRRALG